MKLQEVLFFVTALFLFVCCAATVIQDQRQLNHLESNCSTNSTGCECIDYNCGCCAYMDVPEIHLDDTLCANVSYLSEQYGVSLTVTIDDYAIINETVSARNPPPICVAVPHLKEEASICLDLYDLDIDHGSFSGCSKLVIYLVHIKLVDMKLGCWKVGTHRQFTTSWLANIERAQMYKRMAVRAYDEEMGSTNIKLGVL